MHSPRPSTTLPTSGELRFVTFLAPAIPLELFETAVDRVAAATRCKVSLRVESRLSGPEPGGGDLFSQGDVDAGWICSPSFLWLRDESPPAVDLLPVGPVFRDDRNRGRPAVFADVVVRRDDPARTFRDLRGRRWVYNDRSSMSGYFSVFRRLAALQESRVFFATITPSGAHISSMELVASGAADGAAIDSNVLRIALERRADLRDSLRVLESWGPFPIQPLVARRGLRPEITEAVAAALLGMHHDPDGRRVLESVHIEHFAAIDPRDYESERRALRRCSDLLPPPVTPSGDQSHVIIRTPSAGSADCSAMGRSHRPSESGDPASPAACRVPRRRPT